MDWSQAGGALTGLLMFGVTIFGVLRKKAGHVLARRAYPSLAADLGLVHQPSRYASGVGKLTGSYQGFSVQVDPDDQRRIRVSFAQPPGAELWNHEHNRRPPPGMTSFRPRGRHLAALFRTCQGTPGSAERLEAGEDLEPVAQRLRLMRELKTLSVTEGGVSAGFDFGNPPFIPEDVVRAVLPDLVAIARKFEATRES